MTQEEKELLLKDLCARFLYGVFLKIGEYSDYTLQGIVQSNVNKPLIVRCNGSDFECSIEVVKPYLRPISSMTEEEEMYLKGRLLVQPVLSGDDAYYDDEEILSYVDYCYHRHLDIRGLIPEGLALEAPKGPKGMYNIKEK